jgi:hypothetical protein
MKNTIDAQATQLGTMGTNLNGVLTDTGVLKTNDTKIQTDIGRMITALKKDPHMGGTW